MDADGHGLGINSGSEGLIREIRGKIFAKMSGSDGSGVWRHNACISVWLNRLILPHGAKNSIENAPPEI
jgi:hypothetical protein